MIFKTVYFRDLTSKPVVDEFEAFVNDQANEGWKLHSVVPQVYEGTTNNNVVIFSKEI